MLKIYSLNEKKSLYPILAYWSFNNWYLNRNIPFKFVLHDYKRRIGEDSLPCSFVAFWGELPVGMVSIKETDMAKREELSPWLSALFVSPEYRKKGIGTELINAVIELSSRRDFKRIFLFIDSRFMMELENFYMSRGWIFLDEEIDSDGNRTKILFHDL
jgi:GNAT superfamily N-acetyltransferase